jgi:hypothetical protein
MESMALKDTVLFNVLKNRAFFKESDKIETFITPSLRLETKHYGDTQPRKPDAINQPAPSVSTEGPWQDLNG